MKFATASAWIMAASVMSTADGFAGPFAMLNPAACSTINPIGGAFLVCVGYRASCLHYENEKDPSSSSGSGSSSDNDTTNVWSILAHTERWISETLASSETENGGNPYSRKEVNYVCETQQDSPLIAANLFKRLREARQAGEFHGQTEEERLVDQGSNYRPHTLRQTQVMVIPSNPVLSESFQVFDEFINAINSARRNARDYVTDDHLEKLEEELAGEATRDWSVSVNCAHLHPHFGKKTAEETLQEMKEEEAAGEVDVHQQEYAEKRLLARQSPYPSVVLEVRAQPPTDFGASPAPQQPPVAEIPVDEGDEEQGYNRKEFLKKDVTKSDVQKLEALFGMAAVTQKNVQEESQTGTKEQENSFYDAIGMSLGEVSSISHMRRAQDFVKENDTKFSPITSAFTESDTTEIDHGYEFVFTNMAMQKEQASVDNIHGARRQYLVMPRFLSSSATSLEKFSQEVKNIVATLPDLRDRVKLSTFHPEHVQQDRRSPMPIICLQWIEGGLP